MKCGETYYMQNVTIKTTSFEVLKSDITFTCDTKNQVHIQRKNNALHIACYICGGKWMTLWGKRYHILLTAADFDEEISLKCQK